LPAFREDVRIFLVTVVDTDFVFHYSWFLVTVGKLTMRV
jgi:hypothetical protein